jgi:hypothetical protein
MKALWYIHHFHKFLALFQKFEFMAALDLVSPDTVKGKGELVASSTNVRHSMVYWDLVIIDFGQTRENSLIPFGSYIMRECTVLKYII